MSSTHTLHTRTHAHSAHPLVLTSVVYLSRTWLGVATLLSQFAIYVIVSPDFHQQLSLLSKACPTPSPPAPWQSNKNCLQTLFAHPWRKHLVEMPWTTQRSPQDFPFKYFYLQAKTISRCLLSLPIKAVRVCVCESVFVSVCADTARTHCNILIN